MEVALEKMCRRLLSRRAFGKVIAEHSVWEERIARARCEIEMARLLCLKAAHKMDVVGSKAARAMARERGRDTGSIVAHRNSTPYLSTISTMMASWS